MINEIEDRCNMFLNYKVIFTRLAIVQYGVNFIRFRPYTARRKHKTPSAALTDKATCTSAKATTKKKHY